MKLVNLLFGTMDIQIPLKPWKISVVCAWTVGVIIISDIVYCNIFYCSIKYVQLRLSADATYLQGCIILQIIENEN